MNVMMCQMMVVSMVDFFLAMVICHVHHLTCSGFAKCLDEGKNGPKKRMADCCRCGLLFVSVGLENWQRERLTEWCVVLD